MLLYREKNNILCSTVFCSVGVCQINVVSNACGLKLQKEYCLSPAQLLLRAHTWVICCQSFRGRLGESFIHTLNTLYSLDRFNKKSFLGQCALCDYMTMTISDLVFFSLFIQRVQCNTFNVIRKQEEFKFFFNIWHLATLLIFLKMTWSFLYSYVMHLHVPNVLDKPEKSVVSLIVLLLLDNTYADLIFTVWKEKAI